jgi:endonuclease YncB( thermonuclease family)
MQVKAILYTMALLSGTTLAVWLPSISQQALDHHTPPMASGLELQGHVSGVLSGDTLSIETVDGRHVRATLWGIAAPTLRQAYGEAARVSLSELTVGKPLWIRIEEPGDHNRALAAVYVGTLEVGKAQAGRGLAWITPAGERDAGLVKAQRGARARQAGLWRDPEPVAPWAFRGQAGDDIAQGRAAAPDGPLTSSITN